MGIDNELLTTLKVCQRVGTAQPASRPALTRGNSHTGRLDHSASPHVKINNGSAHEALVLMLH